MKARIASRLAWASGSLRIDEGCTVAVTNGATSDGTNRPRSTDTLKAGPITALAAVAPRHTMIRGRTVAISASSHGRQAAISPAFGLACILRFPLGSHL